MNSILALFLSVISAYLIGSIPTSFILAKLTKGIDIRDFGSGNVGATNVFRVVGKMPALIALIVDVAKGALVVTLVADYFYSFVGTIDSESYRAVLGFTAICGHIWPVFLGFKGGKGVATTIGVVSVIAPTVFLLAGAVWLLVFSFTSYVSLASLSLGVALPVFAVILNKPFSVVIFAVAICAINSYKHKENIKRLVNGEEMKTIIIKKKVKI